MITLPHRPLPALVSLSVLALSLSRVALGMSPNGCVPGEPCPPVTGISVLVVDPGFTVGPNGHIASAPDIRHLNYCQLEMSHDFKGGRKLFLGANPGNCSWPSSCPDCGPDLIAEVNGATCELDDEGSVTGLDPVIYLGTSASDPTKGVYRFVIHHNSIGVNAPVMPRLFLRIARPEELVVRPTMPFQTGTTTHDVELTKDRCFMVQLTYEDRGCSTQIGSRTIGETENYRIFTGTPMTPNDTQPLTTQTPLTCGY